MPKLSVSVPDELWDAVWKPGMSASVVVQEAVRCLTSRKAADEALWPDDDAFGRLVEEKVAEARALHAEGFEAGIRSAAQCRWADIERLNKETPSRLSDRLDDEVLWHIRCQTEDVTLEEEYERGRYTDVPVMALIAASGPAGVSPVKGSRVYLDAFATGVILFVNRVWARLGDDDANLS